MRHLIALALVAVTACAEDPGEPGPLDGTFDLTWGCQSEPCNIVPHLLGATQVAIQWRTLSFIDGDRAIETHEAVSETPVCLMVEAGVDGEDPAIVRDPYSICGDSFGATTLIRWSRSGGVAAEWGVTADGL
jgi:hypothetical protein